MPGRTCSYMPVIPAPPSNRLRVGDPYRPSLQASSDGRMRCHYGITAGRATLGGGGPALRARVPGLVLAHKVCAHRGTAAIAWPRYERGVPPFVPEVLSCPGRGVARPGTPGAASTGVSTPVSVAKGKCAYSAA